MKTVLKTAEEKMEKSLDAVARDFASVRAGRANPSVLDRVSVDYYGCPTPVNQMASRIYCTVNADLCLLY